MPEGDSLHLLAARLNHTLVGQPIVQAAAREPAVERGLVGLSLVAAGAVGKHLLLRWSDDSVIRVHLGMEGRWSTVDAARSSGALPDLLGLRLQTAERVHLLLQPRHLERFPLRELGRHPILSTLGPDLCLPQVDLDLVLSRVRDHPCLAALLLDQRVASGIGNIYKTESLFLEGLHPLAPARQPPKVLRRLYLRAHHLLRANLRPGPRITTGRNDPPLWVYGAHGRPCLRCGSIIRRIDEGPDGRISWVCEVCQPLDGPR